MDDKTNFEEKKFWKQPKFLVVAGLAGLAAAILFFGGKVSGESSLLGNFSAAVFETFGDVFRFREEKPIYELDLAAGEGRDLALNGSFNRETGVSSSISQGKSDLNNKKPSGTGEKVSGLSKSSNSSGSKKSNPDGIRNNELVSSENNSSTSGSSSSQNSQSVGSPFSISRDCPFSSGGPPVGGLNREVVFNEVAWMGSGASANDEWMELKNNSSGSASSPQSEINLKGWQIKNEDESIKIIFGAGEKISAGGLFLLERTDDNSVPQVTADKIYVGALSNTGEWLKLFDANCNLTDEVNAGPSASSGSSSWQNFGGNNETKKTLERNQSGFGWHTSFSAGGTPRAKNSEPIAEQPPVQPSSSQPTPPPQPDYPPTPPSQEQPTSTPTSTPDQTPPPPPPPSQSEPKILVSEVMAGSSSSVDDEFIEIYNYGSQSVDLTGWTIKKKSSTGSESSLVAASRLEGKIIPAGKYFLLAHEEGYTGAVAPDIWWPKSYALAYKNNTVTIYSASGAIMDEVSWAEIPKDKSYARSSLDISAGFTVSDTPGPQNSQ